MTADGIRELIEREVTGDWSITNGHGCDLRRCLVPPVLRDYDDHGGGRPPVEPCPVLRMWLVLEEMPEDRSGYKVVYGEEAGMFGLALPGEIRDAFIGYYGSFLDTYHRM